MGTDPQQQPITFAVPGIPIPKARPRILRSGRAYTPAKSAAFERQVAWAALEAIRGHSLIAGACQVVVRFDMPIPASWSAKKRAAAVTGEVLPIGKPDVDNLLKAVLDGVRGVVLGDDAAVVHVLATKRYGLTPQTICTITPHYSIVPTQTSATGRTTHARA